jgi:hypothetical protein
MRLSPTRTDAAAHTPFPSTLLHPAASILNSLGGCFQSKERLRLALRVLIWHGEIAEKPMATIILANFFVFIIVSSIATFKGLDLKKRSSWVYGLYGFISGFLIGFLRADDSGGYHFVTNLTASFQAGLIFAFVVLFGGATNRWHRSIGEKYLARSEEDFQQKTRKSCSKSFQRRIE